MCNNRCYSRGNIWSYKNKVLCGYVTPFKVAIVVVIILVIKVVINIDYIGIKLPYVSVIR